jgi:predicted MFS family arabinose efflux permease
MAVFFQLHLYLRSLGINPEWFGFVIGADAMAGLCLQPILSPYLHSGNARKWMLTGIGGFVVALLFYKTALTLPSLIVVRVIQGSGFGFFIAALMATVVDYIPPQKSGQAFGLISLSRLIPFALMPPILDALGNTNAYFARILQYGALCMILSAGFVVFLKTPTTGRAADARQRRYSLDDLGQNLRNRRAMVMLIVTLLLYSGYTTTFFFLKGYGIRIGIGNAGFFFAIATGVMIAVRLLGGHLLDRFDKPFLTMWCMAELAICYVCLPHILHVSLFYGVAAAFGLGWGVASSPRAYFRCFSPPGFVVSISTCPS